MSGAAPVDVGANLARVRERIARAAERSGREAAGIRLVAVSKLVEAERVREAVAAGATDLGENYVQEAEQKRPLVPGPVRWHLIGHLQRNKAAKAAALFDVVQTIDDARTAAALARHARQRGRELEVLLQVNTSGEATKSGVAPEAAGALLEAVTAEEGIRTVGLMTIGRWDPDPEKARPEFRLLARLAEQLRERYGVPLPWLSMGMSHDFEVAIEEGASIVRVGTAIFGARPG
jgi:pyridoxal phosphate enzyme (YggS family)